jgi:hypothetical protein
MESMDLKWADARPPERALPAFYEAHSKAIKDEGYKLTRQGSSSLEYTRAKSFSRKGDSFAVICTDAKEGSRVAIVGKVRPKLAERFKELKLKEPPPLEAEETRSRAERRAERRAKREERAAPESNAAPTESNAAPTESNGVAAGSNGAPIEAEQPDEQEGEETPDFSVLEGELKDIYEAVGHPDAFAEAMEKVHALASELFARDDITKDEALYAAFLKSLAEHRDYLAAKGLA